MAQAAATLTEADNGKDIDVHVGDTIVLRLAENPTTGFRWAFEELDTAAISAKEGDHTHSAEAVGSGGEMTWRLVPAAPGSTPIKLKLWRHWEGDTSVRKRFAVTLKVSP
ncbi:MAG: protease inhibitor I42 family protein [Acidobacteriota bacterium]